MRSPCTASPPCRRILRALPYVDPDAPKGGRLDLAYLGAFDSLNPYNVKALSTAQGLTAMSIRR